MIVPRTAPTSFRCPLPQLFGLDRLIAASTDGRTNSTAPPLGKPKGRPAELPREESAPDLPWDDDPGFDFDPSRPDDS